MRKIQVAAVLFIALLGGCSSVPPFLPPPPATGPAVCAPCQACPVCPAVVPAPVPAPAFTRTFQPAAWSDLPGWADDNLDAAWPAFMQSCRGINSKGNGAAWKRVCDLARASDGKPGLDARRFFEQNLMPFAVANGDGAVSGLVTGYYEPLLRGSRTRIRGYEQPVRGVPDDLLTIDLSAVFPELKDKRVRGRLEGNKVVPYWSRAEIAAQGDKAPG